jgi:hypothetical protein
MEKLNDSLSYHQGDKAEQRLATTPESGDSVHPCVTDNIDSIASPRKEVSASNNSDNEDDEDADGSEALLRFPTKVRIKTCPGLTPRCLLKSLGYTLYLQLMSIVCDENNSSYVTWLPHGRGFRIGESKAFEQHILKKFFSKNAKFSSFTRKLNRWGFVRVSRGKSSLVPSLYGRQQLRAFA